MLDMPKFDLSPTSGVTFPASFAGPGVEISPVMCNQFARLTGTTASGAGSQPLTSVVPVLAALVGPLDRPGFTLDGCLHLQHTIRIARPTRTGEHLRATVRSSGTWRSFAGRPVIEVRATVIDTANAEVAAMELMVATSGSALGFERWRPSRDTRPRREVGRFTIEVPEEAPALYAIASGDVNPLHLDRKVAQRSGFRLPPLQGLCLLGMTWSGLGDLGLPPESIRSSGVQFVRPVYPPDLVEVVVWTREGPEPRYAFECHAAGRLVAREGWVVC